VFQSPAPLAYPPAWGHPPTAAESVTNSVSARLERVKEQVKLIAAAAPQPRTATSARYRAASWQGRTEAIKDTSASSIRIFAFGLSHGVPVLFTAAPRRARPPNPKREAPFLTYNNRFFNIGAPHPDSYVFRVHCRPVLHRAGGDPKRARSLGPRVLCPTRAAPGVCAELD
jgi:hypothetical protein